MFRPKYPDIIQPEYMSGGIHVRRFASIIAIVKLVLSALQTIPYIFAHAWISIGLNLLFSLLLLGTILLADKFEKPCLYLPYLIIMAISLFFCVLGMVIATPVVILSPLYITEAIPITTNQPSALNSTIFSDNKIEPLAITATLMNVLIIIIIYVVIECYCWNVVRKARRYMINEVTSGNVQRNSPPIGFKNQSLA